MNRRTLLRAGVGLTAALASGTNKADTPTVACQCDGLSAARPVQLREKCLRRGRA